MVQNRMVKKGFIGAIVLAVILFGGVILGLMCTERIPAGYVGVVYTGDICIDAACVYGGRLCALVIQDDGNSLCMYVSKNKEDDF